jgi:cytochrome b pre-mRNA-processing protein 3
LSTLAVVASGAVFYSSGRDPSREAVDRAYCRVVEQARQAVFFIDYRVPDTLDGRFELICLHAFLYLHRLKDDRPQASRFCQSLFDTMFADFDRSLREMGVGDLSVGPHVKRMSRAFYGRIIAYEAGLAGDDSTLTAALARNVFGTTSVPQSAVGAMAAYVRDAVGGLRSQPADDLLAGHVSFAAPSYLTRKTR